jgi:hypothetical protein
VLVKALFGANQHRRSAVVAPIAVVVAVGGAQRPQASSRPRAPASISPITIQAMILMRAPCCDERMTGLVPDRGQAGLGGAVALPSRLLSLFS